MMHGYIYEYLYRANLSKTHMQLDYGANLDPTTMYICMLLEILYNLAGLTDHCIYIGQHTMIYSAHAMTYSVGMY